MELPSDLPAGRMVTPKLWVSNEQVSDVAPLWARLHAARSGWWPLLLAPDVSLDDFGPEQEVTGDASFFLAQAWESRVQADSEPEDLPYPNWPGLAPACPPGPDPDQVAASYVTRAEVRAGEVSDPFAHLEELPPDTLVPNPLVGGFLGLVETSDSAGAIAASGWEHDLAGGAEATSVLRSWEERFGVRLCAIGFDGFYVTAAWPAPATDLARRIAAEHVAFCPDILGEVDFDDYADGLTTTNLWRFWWD
jgi:hypothetical protein